MTLHPKKQHILDIYGREPQSLDQLAECVIAVINHRRSVVGFAWHVHKGYISNSHSAPLDGVQNWRRKDDKPKSYSGWSGRVWIRYAGPERGFGSDAFSYTLTYPGTGGWGAYDGPWMQISQAHFSRYGYKKQGKNIYPEPQIYSWDYQFFDSDWPELYRHELFDILGEKARLRNHQFIWNDPAVNHADAEFILLE